MMSIINLARTVAICALISGNQIIAADDSDAHMCLTYEYHSKDFSGMVELMYEGSSKASLTVYSDKESDPVLHTSIEINGDSWIQHVYTNITHQVVECDLSKYEKQNMVIATLNLVARQYGISNENCYDLPLLVPKIVIEYRGGNLIHFSLGITTSTKKYPVFSWADLSNKNVINSNACHEIVSGNGIYSFGNTGVLAGIADKNSGKQILTLINESSGNMYNPITSPDKYVTEYVHPKIINFLEMKFSVERATDSLPDRETMKQWMNENQELLDQKLSQFGSEYYQRNKTSERLGKIRNELLQWAAANDLSQSEKMALLPEMKEQLYEAVSATQKNTDETQESIANLIGERCGKVVLESMIDSLMLDLEKVINDPNQLMDPTWTTPVLKATFNSQAGHE